MKACRRYTVAQNYLYFGYDKDGKFVGSVMETNAKNAKQELAKAGKAVAKVVRA